MKTAEEIALWKLETAFISVKKIGFDTVEQAIGLQKLAMKT